MIAANPEVAGKLDALMQTYIDRGRSTPGAVQRNNHELSLRGSGDPPKGKKKAKGREAKG